ncbi:MAG TPA: glycoside hydrolase family 127 protein, partial [Candidatus Aminicenantes bacterium]|nr:glycoside hydrolase family 127 protein [Candidatus Aminicenantes bacterium]
SGVGLDGLTFFYENPLESDGKTALYQGQVGRSPWFEVACCPPNILRFLPSVPGYVYAVGDDSLYVNLFMTNTAVVDLAGTNVGLAQETKYPWEGTVKLTVSPEKEADFALRIRIPGWARNEPVPGGLYHFLEESEEPPALTVNGEAAGLALENGYAVLRRTWRKGDAVALRLPMPVRRIAAKAEVAADAGRVAFQRGPLVYCAEAVDNGGHVLDLSIMDGARFSAEFRPDLLNGIVVLSRETLRGTMRLGAARVRDVLLVPYYAWANRGPGEMRVWFPRD